MEQGDVTYYRDWCLRTVKERMTYFTDLIYFMFTLLCNYFIKVVVLDLFSIKDFSELNLAFNLSVKIRDL